MAVTEMSHEKEIEKDAEELDQAAVPAAETASIIEEPAVDVPVGEEGSVQEGPGEEEASIEAPAELEAPPQETPSVEAAPEESEETVDDAATGELASDAPKWEDVCQQLEGLKDPEEQLKVLIVYMAGALARAGSPSFKNFWEARRRCLPLFKETTNPAVRSQLWEEFSNLSREARRLKEILDEQTAFAVEQIEVAISALEAELQDTTTQLERMSTVDLNSPMQTLEAQTDFYNACQRELNLLNAFAGRINGLRKELIKTEMRIRQKNKFFQRLSAAGDQVFPRRKELIKQVSDAFIADIDRFLQGHFQQGAELQGPVFQYREEIKALQGVAKNLTLNTHAFTHTRASLSSCWDRLKDVDKERKRDRAQKRAEFRENRDKVEQEITAVQEQFAKEELNVDGAMKALDAISSDMRGIDLGREDVKFLRDKLHEVRQPMFDKLKALDEDRRRREQEREEQRQKQVTDLKAKIEALVAEAPELEADALSERRGELQKEVAQLSANKGAKQPLERLLKPLKDLIAEKREKALLALSDDDRQALDQLRLVLSERVNRRKEIKDQLEALRKAQGSSGMDFEKALLLTEQVNEEKDRLDKVTQGIQEVEEKIRELETKI